MQPDKSRPTTPQVPARDNATPHVPERQQHREAAANLARMQADAAMAGHDPVGNQGVVEPDTVQPATQATQPEPAAQQPAQTEETPAINPYLQTRSNTVDALAETGGEWDKYHSAWQRYYQEYYSRFYVGELYKTQTELMKRADERAVATKEGMTKDEAMDDLRSQLRGRISEAGKKVRGSRHFIPITAAIVVMLAFVFLQYNGLLISQVKAFAGPGNIAPANVLTRPDQNLEVPDDQNNHLIIPKLNIDVPVDFNAKPDNDSQMAAMNAGVAYFGIPGANAKPGQVGNFGIAGHSSNQWYETGAYKFIFVNLTDLQKGDSIYVTYNNTRYTYTVTKTQVVNPDQVSALQDNAQKPEVTLITCTPAGTALQRLLVTAEQVSPDPSTATKNTSESTGSSSGAMPGNQPTVLEKLFGG